MADMFGAGKGRPSNTDESIQNVMRALTAYYPEMAAAIRSQLEPQAAAELGVAQKYAPQMAQLGTDIYKTQAPALAEAGREISRAEQLDAARTEADIAAGAGADTARAVAAVDRELNPEAFASKEALAAELDKAFSALGDPGTLSKQEEESVARGLGRTNWIVGSPNEAWKRAAVFGDAAKNRRAEFNNLINLRAGVTPALTKTADVSNLTARRVMMPNTGLASYTGVQTPGVASANALGSAAMNNFFATDRNRENVYGQWINGKVVGSGVGNILGAVVSGVAACWVAREVYGTADDRWTVFRDWMLWRSPDWFREAYMKHGERFAAWLHGRPMAKRVVKWLMDFIVNGK